MEVNTELADILGGEVTVGDLVDRPHNFFGVCVMVRGVRRGSLSLWLPSCAVAVWHMCGPVGRVGTVRRDLIGAWSIPNRRMSTERSLRLTNPREPGGTLMMMTIGGDSHKRTHTFVAVDDRGRRVAEKTVPATTDGHLDAVAWGAQWPKRRWALEDCRQVTRRLEGDLLRAGETVIRVPTKLMADLRRGAREPGKSDPIDALAVARAALREPDLPVARLDGEERRLKLLVDHREDLISERTRMQSRLRWHLHELMPEHIVELRTLRRFHVLDDLARRFGAIDGLVAAIASELIARIRELTIRINELEREITGIVTDLAPTLLGLEGCGALSAAKIVAETAGVDRFRSRAAFARWNGTAPIPVWTGNERFRLNRGGNRQVNAAIHRIAITQWRGHGRGHDYVQGRIERGDTKRSAIRALKRRLSDEVFRRLHTDAATTQTRPLDQVA